MDLIAQGKGGLIPVEIKLIATPQPQHIAGLKRFRELAGEGQCGAGALVCRVAKEQPLPHGVTALPWHSFADWLDKQI